MKAKTEKKIAMKASEMFSIIVKMLADYIEEIFTPTNIIRIIIKQDVADTIWDYPEIGNQKNIKLTDMENALLNLFISGRRYPI